MVKVIIEIVKNMWTWIFAFFCYLELTKLSTIELGAAKKNSILLFLFL